MPGTQMEFNFTGTQDGDEPVLPPEKKENTPGVITIPKHDDGLDEESNIPALDVWGRNDQP